MNDTRIPGFTAENSIYRTNANYTAREMFAGPGRRADVLVQPAAKPIFYRSMKGWCLDLLGAHFCCNGDECGPDVFI